MSTDAIIYLFLGLLLGGQMHALHIWGHVCAMIACEEVRGQLERVNSEVQVSRLGSKHISPNEPSRQASLFL